MAKRVIFITGASSGMGYAATVLFAQHGWEVYASARRVEKIPTGDGIHPMYLDVTDAESRQKFVADALTDSQQINVLLNNAGYGEFGPLEEVGLDKVKKQLDTNLVGLSELTKLVLPRMREQGYGRIINNSSIGGDIYSPLGGWYYVTKHGLNVWSDVLDTEIRQFGLQSIIIEPGGTESAWTDIAMENALENLKPNSPYQKLTSEAKRLLGSMLNSPEATSEDLAKVFYRAATDRHPKRRYYFGLPDRLISSIARKHPGLFHQFMTTVVRLALKANR
ncbi:SDR family NAD(P)-dependent oxidoreductase [Secundilactobacillus folii]|uniref:SDR family NAD(P)-dependent oxidoreductase n=1 Tax=Secundilactobacillus folii TaxID=2678357 RepID=A0A7X3C2W3_9LACO|nr:SDR family NAD(P)-dependent oxidoreductase [Secundilactobacillus folii]MTV82272.1 SDR family NAD(P)-dependent oxidoreductase [Secundilactobacillus folii]